MNHDKLFVYHLHQDDPKKCTASKLLRFNLIKPIQRRHIINTWIVLNPFSDDIISKADQQRISNGLVVIDCSWKKGTSIFSKSFRGRNKRLPILQAGNPINYGKLFTLSSAEALAACLFIIGFRDDAELILSKFKWGHTFFDLNYDILEQYSSANNSEEISIIVRKYYNKFLP